MLNILSYSSPKPIQGHVNVWPYQANQSKELIDSMVKHKLGQSIKINARDCIINELDRKVTREFLANNHLNGCTKHFSNQYGLLHKDELIMVITLGIPRYTKNVSLEVIRMASKKNYIVRGGASKLFNHIKLNHDGILLSYSDNMIGDGSVYKNSGFRLDGETGGSYFWEKDGKILFRYHTMKSKLSKLFNVDIDLRKTERQIMTEFGWRIVPDSGNKRWIMDLTHGPIFKKMNSLHEYHYVYKITRQDGNFYYGIHSTNNIDDDYMGSGYLIEASINKHGKEFHHKEIIKKCNSRLEACKLEAKIVNEELLKDPKCMNIALGGASTISTMATKNFTWISSEEMQSEVFIDLQGSTSYLESGWKKGRLKSVMRKGYTGKWYVNDEGKQSKGISDKPSKRLKGTTNGMTWVIRDGKYRCVKEVLDTDVIGAPPSKHKGKKMIIVDGVQRVATIEESIGQETPAGRLTGRIGMRSPEGLKKLVSPIEARELVKLGWVIATTQLKSAPPQVLELARELGMKLPIKKKKI